MNAPFGSRILDTSARILFPFILLFGAYVVLHGHYSPGGGFQGGVIFAVAFILLRLVIGSQNRFGPNRKLSLTLSASGVMIFLGIGFLSMFYGENFLNYGGIKLGIPPIAMRVIASLIAEIGIAICVTGTLLLIFDALTEGKES